MCAISIPRYKGFKVGIFQISPITLILFSENLNQNNSDTFLRYNYTLRYTMQHFNFGFSFFQN